MRITRSGRRRIVRLGSIFVLLMVMLPSIAYVGHWDSLHVKPTHAHSLHHEPNDRQDHTDHCHEGPSTCTGPQATTGSWWIGEDPSPIVTAGSVLLIHLRDDHSRVDAFEDRIVPPPRFA